MKFLYTKIPRWINVHQPKNNSIILPNNILGIFYNKIA